jgi:hypothetical protein
MKEKNRVVCNRDPLSAHSLYRRSIYMVYLSRGILLALLRISVIVIGKNDD